ncbi:MAG: substrate-binding domain-containing protein [Planctomycetes bacterium]|nr:substrate-binding domain-containing protein [Planctomycetota bacterium]
MTDEQYAYGSSSKQWVILALLSVVFIVVLILLIPNNDNARLARSQTEQLTVYCAAGVRLPVQEIAEKYEKEYGVHIRLDFGSSGAMEARLRNDVDQGVARADMYIPADTMFAHRAAADGLCDESIALAQFALVLATQHDDLTISSVEEFIDSSGSFTICNKSAAAGNKFRKVLTEYWPRLQDKKMPEAATVVEAATWIKENKDIRGGFIWDSTARQFQLRIITIPELASARSTITANICKSSRNPTRALHFARYMAAPDRGAEIFAAHNFSGVDGDQWADIPRIIFYCGGLNRNAVDPIIESFQQREGVQIVTKYNGCGVLVAEMKSIMSGDTPLGMPDVYMTCDASFMDKVQTSFKNPVDVSTTNVVMVVHKGNPKNIQHIGDLAKDTIRTGTTNPQFSTLGDLSWKLFHSEGVLDANGLNRNITQSAGTAHELLLQMESQHVLDCVLVYRANCNNLSDEYEVIAIKNKLSLAVQNVAAGKESHYPHTVQRLLDRIYSLEGASSFLDSGFNWLYKAPQ